ncbi:Uncharacterised protein [Actinobacillus equuli]|nr:Uncharacterised protein [Actinobacillus equuli]
MCRFPLFETISVIDGEPQNLAYHQQRFESTIKQYFNVQPQWQLAEIIYVPDGFRQGRVRCRIDYNASEFQQQFSFIRHVRSTLSNVCTLRIWITALNIAIASGWIRLKFCKRMK